MPSIAQKYADALSTDNFGIRFSHPVGIGPNFDPEVRKYNSYRPFSFVEVGPVYPESPTGRPPRSLIRRLLMNHKTRFLPGVEDAINHISAHSPHTLIAANIAAMPSRMDGDSVAKDLLRVFTYLYDFADIFVVDTFRKNTDGIAPLQCQEYLSESVDALLEMRLCYENIKPILLRVSNDISDSALSSMLDYMMYSGIDGVIAGVSGDPLPLVRRINEFTKGRFPVVACGNFGPDKAAIMLSEGVRLFQTGTKDAKGIIKYLTETIKK